VRIICIYCGPYAVILTSVELTFSIPVLFPHPVSFLGYYVALYERNGRTVVSHFSFQFSHNNIISTLPLFTDRFHLDRTDLLSVIFVHFLLYQHPGTFRFLVCWLSRLDPGSYDGIGSLYYQLVRILSFLVPFSSRLLTRPLSRSRARSDSFWSSFWSIWFLFSWTLLFRYFGISSGLLFFPFDVFSVCRLFAVSPSQQTGLQQLTRSILFCFQFLHTMRLFRSRSQRWIPYTGIFNCS
jgi:hypothetical protein